MSTSEAGESTFGRVFKFERQTARRGAAGPVSGRRCGGPLAAGSVGYWGVIPIGLPGGDGWMGRCGVGNAAGPPCAWLGWVVVAGGAEQSGPNCLGPAARRALAILQAPAPRGAVFCPVPQRNANMA